MTVAALNVSDGPFTANGSTTVFPFTFSCGNVGEVQVFANGVAQVSGFTVTLNSDQSRLPGGSVTFATAPANAVVILIASNPSFQQLISFRDSGPFLQSTLDTALDRAARLLLYLRDKISRAVVFPVGETVSTLPAKASRLNKYLGFNASGDFVVLDGTTGDTSLRTQLAASTGYALVGGLTQVITPQQFGAVGDNVTDDSAAFVAAIAHANTLATAGFGFGKGAPRVFVPAGKYYLGTTTLDLTYSIIFEGESCGGPSGAATVLRWADGHTGIRTQNYNTTGATGPSTATTYPGAQMATIRNLSLIGGFTSTESESHGIHLRCKAILRDIYIDGFAGDGVHMLVTATSTTDEGNANDSFIENVFVIRCRNACNIDGLDVNGTTIINLNANSNRQWGIKNSCIGINVLGGDFSTNGQVSGFPTMVSYSSHYYSVVAGQEVWCSTHAPSGTTAHNQGWYYVGDGGPTSIRPAWTTGTTYRAGGPIFIFNNSNYTVVSSIYAETDQGPSQIDVCNTIWISPLGGAAILNAGGTIELTDPTYGGQLIGNSGYIRAPRALASGDSTKRGLMTQTENIDELDRYRPRDGTAQLVRAYGANTVAVNSSGGGQFYYYDMLLARIGGLNLKDSLNVNGTKVLGVRDTGWAADTGTAKKTATATYVVGSALTVGAAYVQAEVTAIITRQALVEAALRDATQEIKALKDLILAHGLGGA